MTNAGGWSVYTSDISSEAGTAFDQALKGQVGVTYAPVAVAQQVVAGMNYRFFCNASPVVPNSIAYPAMVSVFKSLDGNAKLIGIDSIKLVGE